MDANTTPTTGGFANKTIKGVGNLLTFLIILIVDIALGFFAFKLFNFGYTPLGICFVLIIIMISVAFLIPKAHMFKWMAVGLSAWLLFSIFPIVYTVYNAFTNYGDGHLISQTQAIDQIQAQRFIGRKYAGSGNGIQLLRIHLAVLPDKSGKSPCELIDRVLHEDSLFMA